MKLSLFAVLLFLSLNVFAQEEITNCEVTLTKEAFLQKPIPDSCFGLSVDEIPPKIRSFKIKFRKHPSISLHGNQLNGLGKNYLKMTPVGDYITIFDIKLLEESNIKPPKSIVIEIVSKKE
ncbi:hypothetical protein C1T31_02410 [Hanstruepera neustonica]|uniref:Gliding motility-associated protein GldM C-terminal domain-containing protein n=1 Tax=Hanstruepera neustonica TaxID=1445657 RepID=A0A2K1E403_9FLAO|nr:hypothetical protein [Hanstruepera neustonica]PNQ75009.1 hypothetical protein C1T31_02410 [Hanstruepera neustonica]